MMKIFASDLDHPEGLAWSPSGWVAAGEKRDRFIK